MCVHVYALAFMCVSGDLVVYMCERNMCERNKTIAAAFVN